VSEATKKDLLKVSSIPSDKIVVIYEGVGDTFKIQSPKDIKMFRKKYQLPEEFVLALGGIGERKNIKRLKIACKDVPLIVSGEDIERVSDEELPLLYASARLLAYPSLYEGFGLPILEAQACGVPVVTSDVSSMPEIGGQGAAYVDPLDIEDIKKTIRKVFYDNEVRKNLIKEGLKNVKQFTWEKTVEQTIEVYKSLGGN
jgi:glycosyltransferase involved in cell wall biosynthesis